MTYAPMSVKPTFFATDLLKNRIGFGGSLSTYIGFDPERVMSTLTSDSSIVL